MPNRGSWILASVLAGIVLISLSFAPCASASDSQDLLDAARVGDLDEVKALLEKGVDPDSRSRYGATPLSFAADKGHLEIVRLLLEKGADPNPQDSFYRATPTYWASSRKHFDVLALLVEYGAPATKANLMLGVRENQSNLVAVLLEKGEFEAEVLAEALGAAVEGGGEEVEALLRKAGAELPDPADKISPEILNLYAGTYNNSTLNIKITFRPEDGKLKGTVPGQPEITYAPKDEKTFESVEFPGITILFERDGDLVPKITLKQGGQQFSFDRVAKEPEVEPSTSVSAEVEKEEAQAYVPVEKPANWPSFRGARASGVADGQRPPRVWDAGSGRNLRWRTTLPGLSHACPVVWEDRVLVTTAVSGDPKSSFRHGQFGDVDSIQDETLHSYRVYSLDRATGKVIWEHEAHRGIPKIRRHVKGSHASCTPATNGERIVVNFAGEGLYCYTMDGEVVWKVDLGPLDSGWFYDPDYQWGFASSPILWKDRVIIQADIQSDSFIAAYRLKDGKQVWRVSREEIPSWGTPTLVSSPGRDQVVTNSSGAIYGYDAPTGKELWRLRGNSEVTVATPIFAYGLMFFTGGYHPFQPIYAVKVGAVGDITLKSGESSSDAVAWSQRRGGTYMPTPIVYGEHLYTCGNSGVLTCYVAKTGERLYRARINEGRGGGYTASPVAADGALYFTSEDGEVNVVKAGAEYELLASNSLGAVCLATPAISAGMIFFRSTEHVLAFGRGGD